MPPAQVQELVAEVKAWYETHKNDTRQRDLAAKLGVSPTGLCQIFAGVNQPSASTALAMIRFLEENQSMKTNYVDPRTAPRQAAGNPGPKTLTEARERIESLEAQLVQLRGAAPNPVFTMPAPTTKPQPVLTAPAATAKPKLAGSVADTPTIATPGAERLSPTPMPVNFPAPEKKTLPASANTPFLITEILKITSFEDCLALLSNPAHTPLQRSLIFAEIKTRRAIAG